MWFIFLVPCEHRLTLLCMPTLTHPASCYLCKSELLPGIKHSIAPNSKHMGESSSHTFQGIMGIDVDDHSVLAMLQAQALNVRAIVVELHGDLATAAKRAWCMLLMGSLRIEMGGLLPCLLTKHMQKEAVWERHR